MVSDAWLKQALDEGLAHLRAKRLKEAGQVCRRLLQAKPDLAPAHFLVGLVALEGNDQRTAFSAFQSVVRLQPGHPAAWTQIAQLLILDGDLSGAEQALSKLSSTGIKDPLLAATIAKVYTKLEDHGAATRFHEIAVREQPEHVPYLMTYATNLSYHGKSNEARQVLQRALALDPKQPQAHWVLSGLSRAQDRRHLEQMEKLLPSFSQRSRESAFLLYAMGKEYEDLEQWDEAFAAFDAGAKARRQTVEYDEQNEIEFFDALTKTLDETWFSSQGAGYSDNTPIFVLGQPRTGTTLIERIITSHSAVHSAGELQQFGFSLRQLSKYREPRRFTPGLLRAAAKIPPASLGQRYCEATRIKRQADRFVDKLPTNFAYLPLIARALPKAKIVHVQRHPMDACFASYKQLFADAYLHSYEQTEMARHHARYYHLMARWRERFPEMFFDISYEETTRDLEFQARRLIRYLDLPWEDACLNFHEQKTAVSTASATQVRQPVHTRSVGRWQKYRDQLMPMMNTLKQQKVPLD